MSTDVHSADSAESSNINRKRTSDAVDLQDEFDHSTSNHATSSTEAAPKILTSKKQKKSALTPGIVYVSRLPPGMTPQKVKYLMERWGDVGRIYAQKKDAPSATAKQSQKRQKHAQALYTEAWVEFLDKKMAKVVAEMLNAQVIGGKKGDRWRDDVWTMKYLSGFRWEMLGEQIAHERQAHAARLRQSLSQSKTEQNEYLKNVELARVLEKRKAKKAEQVSAGGGVEGTSKSKSGASAGGDGESGKGQRKYRQREMAGNKPKADSMSGVMDSIF